MDKGYIKNKELPESPGVYFFKGEENEILYIGKAASLRDRVRSYFNENIRESRGPIIEKMLEQARELEFEQTDSVLEALILEAKLIKKHQPDFNIKEKDDKSFNYVVITKEEFPKVLIAREKELNTSLNKNDIKYAFGPFPHASSLKEAMRVIRKIFPFRDNKCTPYNSSKNDKPRSCFSRQIGLCPGVCTGEITKSEYSQRIQHLRLLFEGKKNTLLEKLEREMNSYARKQKFEKAEEVKREINKLRHIQDISLLKKEGKNTPSSRQKAVGSDLRLDSTDLRLFDQGGFRIEAYDVAHMAGKETVGVMTVVEDGEIKKSEHRKFKIKEAGKGDDAAALREVLLRRLRHTEWEYPDLIVVDGGKIQKNAAKKALDDNKISIPVVAVLKGVDHKPKQLLGDKKMKEQHEREILLANNEAHRSAVSFHRRRRDKI